MKFIKDRYYVTKSKLKKKKKKINDNISLDWKTSADTTDNSLQYQANSDHYSPACTSFVPHLF